MKHTLGQIAVIGQKKQAFTVVVQTSNRVKPDRKIAELVQNRRASLGVAGSGHFAGRFVIHDIFFFGFRRDEFAVHTDILTDFYLYAHFGDYFSVHADASVGNHLLSRTSGGDAAGRQILLQAHKHPPKTVGIPA